MRGNFIKAIATPGKGKHTKVTKEGKKKKEASLKLWENINTIKGSVYLMLYLVCQ